MPTVLMLLTNAYEPDPRVRQEALALIGMGCRVTILAWDRDLKHPAEETREGVDIRRVFLRSTHGRGTAQLFFYAWLYLKLIWRGLTSSFDVVHCHDLDTLPAGYIVGALRRKPVVYDAHESFTDMLRGSVHPTVLRVLVTIENFLIRRVSLLITVGEKLRQHFAERGARRTVVVGNWKRRDGFTRSPEENAATLRRMGIPEDALVVVCITQLLGDRKIEELLGAIDACDGVHLIIAGRGALEPLVRARAGQNPRIHYAGYLNTAAIEELTAAAGVIYYGFDPENPNARFSAPNKLYEALAAGRPLITGDFGEIADVVRRAGCGFVLSRYTVSAVVAALEALKDPGLRHRLGQNALAFGRESASWEMGEKILHQEYSAVLGIELARPHRVEDAGSVPAGGVA